MSAISSEPVVIGCRAPAGSRSVGQRDVDGLLDQHPLLVLGLEHLLAGGERLVDLAAGLADALAGVLAGLRRQRADLAVGERERRTVAGVLDRTRFSASRSAAAAMAASAASRAASTSSGCTAVTSTGS